MNGSRVSAEKRRLVIPGWVFLLIFVAASLRVGFMLFDRGFTSYDDGVAAEGARLVLQGKVPYRDFWTMYSPGGHYVNALGLAVLGHRLIDVRLVGLLLGVVQSALLYAVVRRVSRNPYACVIAAVGYLAFIPIGVPVYWFTAGLGAVYCLLRFADGLKSGWCYLCGVFLGLTVLLRQDAGIYLSIVAVTLVYVIARASGRRGLTAAAKSAVSLAGVCGLMLAYLSMNGALSEMIRDTLYFPLFVFPKSRPLPYPLPWNEVLVIGRFSAPVSISGFYQLFAFYLLPAVLLGFCVVCITRHFKGCRDVNCSYAMALCSIAAVLFLMVGVRPSGARIGASVVMSMVAFSALVSDESRILRIGSWVMLVLSIAAYVPMGCYTVYAQRAYATSAIAGTGGVFAAPGHAEALSAACMRVRQITLPSEKILCGAPVIYFIAQRDPGTRYYEPHPCLTDTANIQKAIIRDIEKNRVRYFVRSREWDFKNGYFTMEPDHQPARLINYIESNYRVEFDYAIFQIYKRVTDFPKS
ncbi:MAG: glycosyltransferase family 39 protein [Armatimonadota bacterium]|nr:glycosyltransferase family 39 protein [bacterium]